MKEIDKNSSSFVFIAFCEFIRYVFSPHHSKVEKVIMNLWKLIIILVRYCETVLVLHLYDCITVFESLLLYSSQLWRWNCWCKFRNSDLELFTWSGRNSSSKVEVVMISVKLWVPGAFDRLDAYPTRLRCFNSVGTVGWLF